MGIRQEGRAPKTLTDQDILMPQDLLGSMPLLPLPHLPPLYYFDSYRTRDQETIDLRLNAITGLMDHLVSGSLHAAGIRCRALSGNYPFHVLSPLIDAASVVTLSLQI